MNEGIVTKIADAIMRNAATEPTDVQDDGDTVEPDVRRTHALGMHRRTVEIDVIGAVEPLILQF